MRSSGTRRDDDEFDAGNILGDVAIHSCEVTRREGLQLDLPATVGDFHAKYLVGEVESARALGDRAAASKGPCQHGSGACRSAAQAACDNAVEARGGRVKAVVDWTGGLHRRSGF